MPVVKQDCESMQVVKQDCEIMQVVKQDSKIALSRIAVQGV